MRSFGLDDQLAKSLILAETQVKTPLVNLSDNKSAEIFEISEIPITLVI